MTKQQFLNDLQKIYDFLDEEKSQTNQLIKHLEDKEKKKQCLFFFKYFFVT